MGDAGRAELTLKVPRCRPSCTRANLPNVRSLLDTCDTRIAIPVRYSTLTSPHRPPLQPPIHRIARLVFLFVLLIWLPAIMSFQFEPVVGMSSLLEFIRFLYTGRSGAMDPLTALDVLFLTKGDEGSGGESTPRFELNVSVSASLPCKCYLMAYCVPCETNQARKHTIMIRIRVGYCRIARHDSVSAVRIHAYCGCLLGIVCTRLKNQIPCIQETACHLTLFFDLNRVDTFCVCRGKPNALLTGHAPFQHRSWTLPQNPEENSLTSFLPY